MTDQQQGSPPPHDGGQAGAQPKPFEQPPSVLDGDTGDIYAKAQDIIEKDPRLGGEAEPGDVQKGSGKPTERPQGQAKLPGDGDTGQGEQGSAEPGAGGGEQKEPRLSSALARIAKQEARARKRLEQYESQLREQSGLLAKKEEELTARYGIIEEGLLDLERGHFDDGLRKIGQIKGLDISYPSLTQAYISGKLGKAQEQAAPTVPDALVYEIQSIKQELAQERALREHQSLSSQANSYKSEVKGLLDGNSYRHLQVFAKTQGKAPLDIIGDYVREHARHTGELIPPKEAIEHIEGQIKQYHQSLKELDDGDEPPAKKTRRPLEEPLTLSEELGQTRGDYAQRPEFTDEAMLQRAMAAIAALKRT